MHEKGNEEFDEEEFNITQETNLIPFSRKSKQSSVFLACFFWCSSSVACTWLQIEARIPVSL